MLKLKQSRGLYKLYLNRSKVFAAMVVVMLTVLAGVWGLRQAGAYEGDYWTTANESGLTMTIVSVEQGGSPIDPEWSNHIFDDNTGDFGNYYFPIANNTDKVRVGILVDGMEPGQNYMIFDNTTLTSDNNGQIIYGDVRPSVYGYNMRDSYECWMEEEEENCSIMALANEYVLYLSFHKANWSDSIYRNIVVRPAAVGSQSIDIVSVKQGEQDLYLDTNGWNITTWEEARHTLQTINEYRIDDYNTPVTVTYKLKGLEIGKTYSINAGNDYRQFKAVTNEVTETVELGLNYTDKHINNSIQLYRPGEYDGNESVYLYFRIADENFVPLGDTIIDGISQGGVALEPVEDIRGSSRQYTFTANDAQSLILSLHSTRATADLNYHLSYNMYGNEYGYISSETPIMVTGEELELGTVLTIPAPFGMSDSSPFSLNLSISTLGGNSYNYGSQNVIYQNYGEGHNSDSFKFNFYEDENVPRYDASMFYSEGTRVESEVIDPTLHDAEHPLIVEVRGERYNNAKTYNVRATVAVEGGETFYDRTFTATGAELNDGTVFRLDGLTLSLPEFDPTGGTSGYDLYYKFSLEIDGLKQSGTMIFAYSGWIDSVITYDGGEVAAMGEGGGIGGNLYLTMNETTVRKTSLSSGNGAVLHYLGGNFDENMDYDYALYYNGNAGDAWWSAEAGTRIENGVLDGRSLNTDGLTVNIATPSNESESMLYTLVISKNGGIVIVSKEFIAFTEAPRIESFKFTADSDSFMQTGRQSYRVAKDTDILATLTGSGFDNAKKYKLWVSYRGWMDGEDEYGEYYSRNVDLSGLNESIIATGAELNAGYNYTLAYSEALDEARYVDAVFVVTDVDSEGPDMYGQVEGGYAGHSIYLTYVNDDEVFRDNGYQINEDGTITDVSQPDEPHGDIPVDIRTPGDVTVTPEGGTLTVVSETPVMVVGFRNGEWVRLFEWDVTENGEERTNHYSIGDCDEVKVVLKGDGDMDGEVTSSDSNLINRSLISPTLRPYRELTELEQVLFDLDGDREVTSSDSNLINRSLISSTLRPYQPIEW